MNTTNTSADQATPHADEAAVGATYSKPTLTLLPVNRATQGGAVPSTLESISFHPS